MAPGSASTRQLLLPDGQASDLTDRDRRTQTFAITPGADLAIKLLMRSHLADGSMFDALRSAVTVQAAVAGLALPDEGVGTCVVQ